MAIWGGILIKEKSNRSAASSIVVGYYQGQIGGGRARVSSVEGTPLGFVW